MDWPEFEVAATGAARPVPVLPPPEGAFALAGGPLPALLDAPTPPRAAMDALALTDTFDLPRAAMSALALVAKVDPPLVAKPLAPLPPSPRAPRPL